MNQAQRNFLIKKIEDQVKAQVSAYEKPQAPNLNNYLLHKVLSGDFKLKSIDEIKKAILNKALNAKQDQNWMTGERQSWSGNGSKEIGFKTDDIFDVDEDYKKKMDAYLQDVKLIEDKINLIKIQGDTLITRIQLASDKTLERMINEIDDMGDISLMDTKIKLLNS